MSIETVELSHLLISLAQSIKEGLGKEGDPHPNIPMAQYSLGMLHMVKHKTQGNRTQDEEKLLDALLQEFSDQVPKQDNEK
ncbi:MAG: hypothetical protein CL916_03965 [Deltaproteobacteria bacterium]|nr:hypothetical protein [Deltaproteobacteria bacterium]